VLIFADLNESYQEEKVGGVWMVYFIDAMKKKQANDRDFALQIPNKLSTLLQYDTILISPGSAQR
jgi:hypothetical protein